jgi:polyphosphate kinase
MLASLSLNVAFLFEPAKGESEPRMAVVQVPARTSRLLPVPGERFRFTLLEEVIADQVDELFPGQRLLEWASFRLSRDSELVLDDEGGQSYLLALEEELRNRRRSAVVRLEVDERTSDRLLALLVRQVGVDSQNVYREAQPLDLRLLFGFVELPGFDALREPPRMPVTVLDSDQQRNIFALLDQRDVLVHHPYESFDPVVAFVVEAADDPDVIAIKHTLYRTSGDSPIVKALTRAADQGKQVTALVELMARFDEQRNINWARELEEMGAHVIYGIRDYKVHAKICLVVRRTKAGLRRYLHLGTGNYNDRTARLYTDFGLLTSSPAFGADASAFFSTLTGYSDPPRLDKLVMAPTGLRGRVLKLIHRETRRALAGQPAEIRAKMNSLADEEIVKALYAASRAGVRIWLNVRGVCILRPGVPGQSDTITVVSIVGRYLEHARVFVFHNGGDQEVYLASADWMTRNLDKRVELMFPVEDPACRRKVLNALDAMANDNVKARRLSPDGSWHVPPRDPAVPAFDAQVFLYEQAVRESLHSSGTTLEPLEGLPGSRL